MEPCREIIKGETKSKHLSLLVYPSIYEKVKEIAYERDISVNEAFNQAAVEFVANNSMEDQDDVLQDDVLRKTIRR